MMRIFSSCHERDLPCFHPAWREHLGLAGGKLQRKRRSAVPDSLSTVMVPSCFSMMVRVMASPRPVPRCLVVKNGEKIFGEIARAAIPTPVSRT